MLAGANFRQYLPAHILQTFKNTLLVRLAHVSPLSPQAKY
ncbi:hypothetical protein FHX03_006260 [Rhizobium sp. BK456]|nr:hypothetical protein [Rhizobium sp. BK456]